VLVVCARLEKEMVKVRGEWTLAPLKDGELKMSYVPAWGVTYLLRSRWDWEQSSGLW
jgi:hypothetical protein